jgi:hypothetical protein
VFSVKSVLVLFLFLTVAQYESGTRYLGQWPYTNIQIFYPVDANRTITG